MVTMLRVFSRSPGAYGQFVAPQLERVRAPKDLAPKLPIPARWDSLADSLKCACRWREVWQTAYTLYKPKSNSSPTDKQWELLTEMKDALSAVRELSIYLQMDGITIRKCEALLRNTVEELRNQGSFFSLEMAKALILRANQRRTLLYKITLTLQSPNIVSTPDFPVFQSRKDFHYATKDLYLKWFPPKDCQAPPSPSPSAPREILGSNVNISPEHARRNRLNALMEVEEIGNNLTQDLNSVSEVEVQMWRDIVTLFETGTRSQTIKRFADVLDNLPASNSGMERSFSLAGTRLTKFRSRLSDRAVNLLTFGTYHYTHETGLKFD